MGIGRGFAELCLGRGCVRSLRERYLAIALRFARLPASLPWLACFLVLSEESDLRCSVCMSGCRYALVLASRSSKFSCRIASKLQHFLGVLSQGVKS